MYRNHMLHHRDTQEDFTIRNGEIEYICFEVFSMDGIVQSIVVFSLNTGVFYLLFHPSISLFFIMGSVATMLIMNILVWNTVHAYVHGFDPAEICSPPGVPRSFFDENTFIVGWLIRNHRMHHRNKNTNFNIVFPGADFIQGTFMEENN